MKDFIDNYYSIVYRIVILSAALTGILLYKRYKSTHIKYFIWFLVWVVVLEILAYYPRLLIDLGKYDLVKESLLKNNYWVYNFGWVLASTLFYPWFLRKKYKSKTLVKIIKYLQYGFIVLFFVTMFDDFTDFFTKTTSLPIVLANIIIILLSTIFYLFEILNSDKLLTFFKSIYFYVAAICFVWWLVHTPLTFFQVYYNRADPDFIVLRNFIKLIMNIIMYFGFTIALIVSKPEYD